MESNNAPIFSFIKKHVRRITSIFIIVVVGINIYTLSSIRYDIIKTADESTSKQFANVAQTVKDMFNFCHVVSDTTLKVEQSSTPVCYEPITEFLDLVSTMENVTTYCYNLDDTITTYRDYFYQTFRDSIKPSKGERFGEFHFNAFGENGELNGLKRCFWIRGEHDNNICVYMFDNNNLTSKLNNKYNISMLVINMILTIILCLYVSIIIVKYIPYGEKCDEDGRKDQEDLEKID